MMLFVIRKKLFQRLMTKHKKSITGIKVIKTFGQETEDIQDFQAKIDDAIIKNRKVNF